MTELIWEGKYKDDRKVTPVRIALPFQTIETINESNDEREKQRGFSFDAPREAEWRNRLIWGDKKYVLPSLLPEFAGKVNMIYIDPPFNVGSDFSFTAKIADDPETDEDESTEFVKQPSIIEQKAYRDTWGKGLDSYTQWFYETVLLLKELLAEDGTIYVHLDWHVAHYAKVVLDEVFGYENFLGELSWCYRGYEHNKNSWNKKHDNIFLYSKGTQWTFNYQTVLEPLSDVTLKKYKYSDKDGRYRLRGRNIKGSQFKQQTDLSPEDESKFPDLIYRQYLTGGVLPRDWFVLDYVNQAATEKLEYQTQKPEALLEKLILPSSNEGDLILDCFCGSGTTAAVAERLGRRWITCDLGRFAIHTARKRFLGIDNVKPFVVQNLGKYERQQWMKAEFDEVQKPAREQGHNSQPGEEGSTSDLSVTPSLTVGLPHRLEQERTYKHFIIDLYHAQPLDGYTWLHGVKAGKMIHVGSVDAPVTVEDIKATIKEFWRLVGTEEAARLNGIDFLGWDFAFDVNETAAHFAAANKVNASFKKIPREVLEKKAVEQGDIKFYELASLDVEAKTGKSEVSVTLKDFIIPPDDVPEEVRGKITHWSQWIDYWAVDWNFSSDTFHNEWQSYRTKKEPKIDLTANNKYKEPGKYTILVKVIDILGNDTTKAVEVEV